MSCRISVSIIPPCLLSVSFIGRVAGSVAQVSAQYSPPRPDYCCSPVSGSRGWHDDPSAAWHEASHTWYIYGLSVAQKNQSCLLLFVAVFGGRKLDYRVRIYPASLLSKLAQVMTMLSFGPISQQLLDGLSWSFVQTLIVPRGWTLMSLEIPWLLFLFFPFPWSNTNKTNVFSPN